MFWSLKTQNQANILPNRTLKTRNILYKWGISISFIFGLSFNEREKINIAGVVITKEDFEIASLYVSLIIYYLLFSFLVMISIDIIYWIYNSKKNMEEDKNINSSGKTLLYLKWNYYKNNLSRIAQVLLAVNIILEVICPIIVAGTALYLLNYL